MQLTILGRQPELSLVELERQFGSPAIRHFSDEAALLDINAPLDIQRFGGVVKSGTVVAELEQGSWAEVSTKIVQYYTQNLSRQSGKITLGISVYGTEVNPRDVQKTGIVLKQRLKKHGVNLRLIPNQEAVLSTATSHHNKLGLSPNKLELLVVLTNNAAVVAESTGAQNITALAARDQGRPKRDAFVGMLPPKLALMMVNMSGVKSAAGSRILDPFCGTGVVLQEAALLGFDVYGSDLAEKMVDYSRVNLDWLTSKYRLSAKVSIEPGDAIEHRWQSPISAVVAETYLGQPFSAPPALDKLDKVKGITNDILTRFLTNLAPQLETDTPLCLAVPAWRDSYGRITQLPLINTVDELGYKWQALKHADAKKLFYYREDQIVARQLLILKRK